jgi:hypothetical protein
MILRMVLSSGISAILFAAVAGAFSGSEATITQSMGSFPRGSMVASIVQQTRNQNCAFQSPILGPDGPGCF